jgi:hypothetical protein
MDQVWDLSSRAEMWSTSAHENVVKGIAWTHDQKLLTWLVAGLSMQEDTDIHSEVLILAVERTGTSNSLT